MGFAAKRFSFRVSIQLGSPASGDDCPQISESDYLKLFPFN